MSNNNKIIDLTTKSCPFAAGVAVSPQGSAAVIAPPCAKEKCAAWDSVSDMCSVLSLAGNAESVRKLLDSIRCELSNLRMVLTPPTTGSPIMRIAEAVEKIVEHQADRQISAQKKGLNQDANSRQANLDSRNRF